MHWNSVCSVCVFYFLAVAQIHTNTVSLFHDLLMYTNLVKAQNIQYKLGNWTPDTGNSSTCLTVALSLVPLLFIELPVRYLPEKHINTPNCTSRGRLEAIKHGFIMSFLFKQDVVEVDWKSRQMDDILEEWSMRTEIIWTQGPHAAVKQDFKQIVQTIDV